MCVVLCSKGYPDKYKKNVILKNLNNLNLETDDYLFHAGTKKKDTHILATGGRVLNFVSLSDSFAKAKNKIHKQIKHLNWEDGFFRKDIGFKVIDK